MSVAPTAKASLVDRQASSPNENAVHIQGRCPHVVSLFTLPRSHRLVLLGITKSKSLICRPFSLYTAVIANREPCLGLPATGAIVPFVTIDTLQEIETSCLVELTVSF
jgi:hypothetical protein